MKGSVDKSHRLLAKYVKNAPVLWLKSHPEYLCRNAAEKAWLKISKRMNVPVHDLKKRWESLRSYTCTVQKKIKVSDNPESLKQQWKYYKDMKFLVEQVETDKETQVEENMNDEESAHDSGSETSDSEVTYDSCQIDTDRMFLLSLLPSLNSLNELQKLQFRSKLNDYLLDIHTQNENGSDCVRGPGTDFEAMLNCPNVIENDDIRIKKHIIF